jgi:hypothetical protein
LDRVEGRDRLRPIVLEMVDVRPEALVDPLV